MCTQTFNTFTHLSPIKKCMHALVDKQTHLLDSLHGWWRILVPAQVDDDPGDIPQEGDGDRGIDEGQQRLDHAQRDDIISTLRAVT